MTSAANNPDELAPLKRAILALSEARNQIDALKRVQNEPIAVVGMGCRFPGGANDPDAFWRLLRAGVNTVSPIPADRWDMDAYFDPDPDVPGKSYTRSGAFLENYDAFDPYFFGISPREATSMDPQHRLLLEVAWEALEHAGLAPDRLAGSRTGVFVGLMTSDYGNLQIQTGDPTLIDAYLGTGSGYSFAAGRLSYVLGFQGPCVPVDTACSSSLVAVHLACQSLRNGESDLALAGGVNLILSPGVFILCCKLHALSADGRSKAFDAAADGYGRGEGCGVVVLKRLSDAQANGDRVLAVIRGSAVNHDGQSGGFTVPNGLAQRALVRTALERGGVVPAEVGYVEAHGTGTALGDPIEVRALAAVLGEGRPAEWPLLVGSVKTNIGHTEGAAGVAGLIKVVLALQHGEVPPHLHFRVPSPHIAWDELPVRVPTEVTAWPGGPGRRVAGVSSFGMGGTNAHVVVEAAPLAAPVTAPAGAGRALQVLPLSARTGSALRVLAGRFADHLGDAPDLALADVAFSAATGRAQLGERLAVVAGSTEQARVALADFAGGGNPPEVVVGRAAQAGRLKVAFLFSGQGAQYPEMGRVLYAAEPVFARALDGCAEVLDGLLDRPLLELLFASSEPGGLLGQTRYTQPALVALEIALAELWKSWGVVPDAVLGHSVGEFAAAQVAGVLSVEDALALVATRGRLMGSLPAGGAMAAVFADASMVAGAVSRCGGVVGIAALNGPAETVVSGEQAAVDAVLAELAQRGVQGQQLVVSAAFHSPLVEPILGPLEQAFAGVGFGIPRIPVVANRTGRVATAAELADPGAWCEQARGTVQFAGGMETLRGLGCSVFVEVGPGAALSGLGRRCVPEAEDLAWLPSLRRGRNDTAQMLESVGGLWCRGIPVAWDRLAEHSTKVALPTSPFERERFWLGEHGVKPRAAEPVGNGGAEPVHPLLGRRLHSPLSSIQFEAELGADAPAYLTDHRIFDRVVLPGAAYVEMALAGAAVLEGSDWLLENVTIHEALVLPEAGRRRTQTIITPGESGQATVQILSLATSETGSWIQHAAATLRASASGVTPTPTIVLDEAQRRCQEELPAEQYYANLRGRGLDYGPAFRGIEQLWRTPGEALALVKLPPAFQAEGDAYHIHPALLDTCFQALGAAFVGASSADIYLPMAIERIGLQCTAPRSLWVHAVARPVEDPVPAGLTIDLWLFDETGRPVGEIFGLHARRASAEAVLGADRDRHQDWLYEVAWRQQARPAQAAAEAMALSAEAVSSEQAVILARRPLLEAGEAGAGERAAGWWLILADEGSFGRRLVERLEALGGSCVLAEPGTTYERLDERRVTFDPTRPDDVHRLVSESVESAAGTCRGVISLLGLDERGAEEPEQATLESAQAVGCGGTLHLVQALAGISGPVLPRLWLVTRAAQAVGEDSAGPPMRSTIWGLGRVIAAEHPALRCARIDLDSTAPPDELDALVEELWADDREDQVAFRRGTRYVARLARSSPPGHSTGMTTPVTDAPVRLEIDAPGVLANLALRPFTRRAPGPGEVEIRVLSSGLNFRDVLNALGMYPGDAGPLGIECAGRISAVGAGERNWRVGDEVVAVAPASFGTYAYTTAAMVVKKPGGISFDEAATIPIAFMTAYYCLRRLAELRPGERVLIHAAAGGVGLAAIQVAQQVGAEIFATAGSPNKREYLRQLGVEHVMDSRSLAFANEIRTLTGGQGVDVVLNSLAGEFVPKSLEVLREGGRFIEIGKVDDWDQDRTATLPPGATYQPFVLVQMLTDDQAKAAALFCDVMERFEDGTFQLLPVRTFPQREVIAAFRHMAQARHIGKIVVSHVDAIRSLAQGRPDVRPDGTYLVTGGLGALGLQVARWLVERGAQHLVLVGRNAPQGEAAEAVASLELANAQVLVARADVANDGGLSALMAEIKRTLPPVRGIIHAAGVLDDGLLVNQHWERFETVLAPKVRGAWNLHRLSRDLPLDIFVLFSSSASLIGPPGQGNYAAANAFLDALAHYRHTLGLPALSINWGPWGAVGLAARIGPGQRTRWGIGEISPQQGLDALDLLMAAEQPQVGVLPVNWQSLRQHFFDNDFPPFLSELLARHGPDRSERPTAEHAELARRLELAQPSDRHDQLLDYLSKEVARVLGLSPDRPPDPRLPLNELGLDSLMAVELKNSLGNALGETLSATTLFDYPTLEALADYLEHDVLGLVSTESAQSEDTAGKADRAVIVAEVSRLSEEELATSIAQEFSDLMEPE